MNSNFDIIDFEFTELGAASDVRPGTISPPPEPDESFYILMEDGSKIILEDASGFILLEAAP